MSPPQEIHGSCDPWRHPVGTTHPSHPFLRVWVEKTPQSKKWTEISKFSYLSVLTRKVATFEMWFLKPNEKKTLNVPLYTEKRINSILPILFVLWFFKIRKWPRITLYKVKIQVKDIIFKIVKRRYLISKKSTNILLYIQLRILIQSNMLHLIQSTMPQLIMERTFLFFKNYISWRNAMSLFGVL